MPEEKTAKPEIRNTKQRRAVKATLDGLEDFISAQDLHMLMASRNESVSLATTYRLLQSMAQNGELDVLRTEDGESIYRMCEANHHHHHLLCRSCGKAEEIEAPSIEDWAAEMGAKFGYSEIDHIVEVTGICSDCVAQKNS